MSCKTVHLKVPASWALVQNKCYICAASLESRLTCRVDSVAAEVSNESSGSTEGALTQVRRKGDLGRLLKETVRTTGVSKDKGVQGFPTRWDRTRPGKEGSIQVWEHRP